MSSFTCFNQLPTELRLKIWEAALPGPRTIDINLSISRDRTTSTPLLTLLSVCSESREVVLKNYRCSFTTSRHPGVYISPELDTILLPPPCPSSCYQLSNCFECFYFDFHSRLSRYDAASVECVESVAVYEFGLEGLGSLLRFFPGVRRLNIVLVDDRTVYQGRRQGVKIMVEELLEKAREDVPELAEKEVEVQIVRGEEMSLVLKQREVEEVV